MKVEEYIWDVFEIKKALEDDSDLEEMWVLHKLNQWRGVLIQQEYSVTQEINPVWLQRIRKFSWTKTNAADDPSIDRSSITLGKYNIPRVISMPYDQGTYRISGSAGIIPFEPIDFSLLMMKAEIREDIQGDYGYYSKVGDTIYSYPYIMEGSAIIIADNPFDVKINDNGVLRDMTFQDDYPLDSNLAQRAMLEFLTKDMAISEGAITDIINDSQSQLKLLHDAQGQVPSGKG